MIIWQLWLNFFWFLARLLSRAILFFLGRWDEARTVSTETIDKVGVVIILVGSLVGQFAAVMLSIFWIREKTGASWLTITVVVMLVLEQSMRLFNRTFEALETGAPEKPDLTLSNIIFAALSSVLAAALLAIVLIVGSYSVGHVVSTEQLVVAKVSHRLKGLTVTLSDGTTRELPRRFLLRSGKVEVRKNQHNIVIQAVNVE